MLVDARSVAAGTTLDCDLCVIGAGAAGIALALELAGTPLRVCLLESGGFEEDADTQSLYAGSVYGRRYFRLDESRTRRFGGSTHCWQGLCRPLDAIDFEVRPWVPRSGWPFGLDELRPFYARAQRLCQLGAFDYESEDWASPQRPLLRFETDSIRSGVFQHAPVRFGEVYRDAVVAAPNVRTLLFANAVELELENAEARRVAGVRVATLAGSGFRVRARIIVLATGGIENARLLLASNRVRAAGLGNTHDLVGRYFMEHPHVASGALLPSRADLPLGFYRPHDARDTRVGGWLGPTERAVREERLLNFCSFLAHEAELPEFEQALAPALAEMEGAGEAPARRAVFFMNECEQAPNSASRVRLGEERDALGMPRVRLEWRLSAADKRSIRRGHELLAAALGASGIGRLQIMLSEDDHAWPPELGGGRHHMGTTRMDVDPRRGVVDADARLHDFDNLYVAGSSVFPTGGAANPTLTLLALALRLADHLRERMR